MWKWTEDRSKETNSQIKFEEFKMGKRLKTGDKLNEYKVVKYDEELFTELEKELG